MSLESIFIIGPGGVGKTTCGRLFADLVGLPFVDLDGEFMMRIGSIGGRIKQWGYADYCRENSRLFHSLLDTQSVGTVYALSSGFLIHGDTYPALAKHRDTIAERGVSILLMPSRAPGETEEIVVARQLARGIPGMREASARAKIRDRFPRYLECGDIQVFSARAPAQVAGLMREAYRGYVESRFVSPVTEARGDSIREGAGRFA